MLKFWNADTLLGSINFKTEEVEGVGEIIMMRLEDGMLFHRGETLSRRTKNLERKLADMFDNPYCLCTWRNSI